MKTVTDQEGYKAHCRADNLKAAITHLTMAITHLVSSQRSRAILVIERHTLGGEFITAAKAGGWESSEIRDVLIISGASTTERER